MDYDLVKLKCQIPVESEKTDKEELKRKAVEVLSKQIADYVILQFDYEEILSYYGYLLIARINDVPSGR